MSDATLLPTLEALCEDRLDAGEFAALSRRLIDDPDARLLYIAYIHLHADLARLDADKTHTAPRLRTPHVPASRRLFHYAAAAAIVLAFTGLMSLLITSAGSYRAPVHGPPVATIIDTRAAAWGPGDLPTSPGVPLPSGSLRLRSGSATIEFYSGAQVTLTGPCVFGLNSPMRGELRRGTLLAYVPPSAHGFTIAAPGLAVVDLGTRFQLDVDKTGASNLRVIEGKVDLTQFDAADHEVARRTLTRGQISRVADGRITTRTLPSVVRGGGAQPLDFADGDFEHLPDGSIIPHQLAKTGVWSGDLATVVGAERGVKPYHGKHMLRFDATGRTPGPGGASEVRQIVTLDPAQSGKRARTMLLTASAQFNRVGAGPQTDTLFEVAIEQFDSLPQPMAHTKPLSTSRSQLISDSDPSTWQRASLIVPLRPDARFAVVTVLALEDVHNDETGPEFAGHYADDVKFQLMPRETP